MNEIGIDRGEELAEKALELVEKSLGLNFDEPAYFFLRSHLTGSFRRLYIGPRESIGSIGYRQKIRSGAYDDIVRNKQKQKKVRP